MLGHEMFLSETNNRHLIAVCRCGWIGTPTTWRTDWDAKTERNRINKDSTIDVVTTEHAVHLYDARADIAERSERALAKNGAYIDKVIPIVSRAGRRGRDT